MGRDLREARESLGISISQLADTLRIRAAHIEALEQGRFADLPGRPYTFGFARSIARHLGVDPDAVAARLRDEVMGTAAPAELVFPESTEDKRLSRTGWVLISLVAVAVAYGAWLAISYRTEQRPAEFSSYTPSPQTVPEVIVEAPEPEPSSPAPDAAASSPRTDAAPEVPPTAPPTATPPTSPAPVPRADTTPPPAAVPATPPRQPPPAPRADATPAQPPSRPAAPATPPAAQSAPRSGATPGPVASAPASPVAPSASGPGAGYNVPQATETEDDPDVTPEPEDSVASGPPGPAAGRVVIRARQDSWVQIQASNGTTVFARTLRAGESFAVPEQTGLRLTTGNAGAIEVIVDGRSAPSLGQVGAVRRNVSLDANRLKAGTALE